jgi:type I restriction enzyme S subunit
MDSKMELKAGYKQTEVGVIPEDWEVKKLNEVTNITRLAGYEYSTVWEECENGEITALRGFNIGKNKIIEKELVRISNKLSMKLIRSRLFKGDLVYPCVGTIGNATVIEEDNKYHIQQNIAKITPNKNLLNSYFLAHYLMSNFGLREVEKFNGSSSQPNILVGSLRKYSIILPCLYEQTAIATALSDTDALISSLEKLITKKRNIKQGAMQTLLQPKEGWEIKKLGDVLKVKHGKSQKEVENISGEYPILGTGGLMSYTNHFLYDKPSVLIGRKGTIDKPQFMSSPFWTVDTLFYTEIFNDYLPKYLYYIFLQIDWYSYNEASGVPSLNAKTIENIEIAIPPTKSEQTKIATILSDMDTEITALETKLAKIKAIKLGMMQNLLTGKIRLI